MKKSKLYTRTGDQGLTSLYNGTRLPKTDECFQALGDLDELNCHIGMAKALWADEIKSCVIGVYSAPGAGAEFYKDKPSIVPLDYSGPPLYYEWFSLGEALTTIQRTIMDISSVVATPGRTDFFNPVMISVLEKRIDRLDSLVPPITRFVVPSGNKLTAAIHVCRSVTRRCERQALRVLEEGCEVLIFLNRLSDFFFALSRFVCLSLDVQEDFK